MEHAGINCTKGWDERTQQYYPGLVEKADIVVIQRDFPRYVEVYEKIIAAARATGKPVVFDIDDLLWDLPATHFDMRRRRYTESILPMIKAIIEADLVTTSSDELRDQLKDLNRNTIVLPNYLDDRLWVRGKEREYGNHKPIVLGYMGSPTHAIDIKFLEPVLQKLVKRYNSKIVLHMYGFPPPVWLKQTIATELTRFSHASYEQFARGFQKACFDIAIAPLAPISFNKCKSSIKYLEYSALGIPGVYSSTPAYHALIQHGKDGLIATTIDEWEVMLIQLIEDDHLRQTIGRKARDKVFNSWMMSEHAGEWLTSYNKICKAPRVDKRQSFLYKLMDAAGRFRQDADQYRIDKLQHELKKQNTLLKSRNNYIAQVLGVHEKTAKDFKTYQDKTRAHIKELETQIEHDQRLWVAVQNSRTWKITNGLNNLLIKIRLKK
jgi:processive 1,2-diacylglycerol beta-glucosyltransferase